MKRGFERIFYGLICIMCGLAVVALAIQGAPHWLRGEWMEGMAFALGVVMEGLLCWIAWGQLKCRHPENVIVGRCGDALPGWAEHPVPSRRLVETCKLRCVACGRVRLEQVLTVSQPAEDEI